MAWVLGQGILHCCWLVFFSSLGSVMFLGFAFFFGGSVLFWWGCKETKIVFATAPRVGKALDHNVCLKR